MKIFRIAVFRNLSLNIYTYSVFLKYFRYSLNEFAESAYSQVFLHTLVRGTSFELLWLLGIIVVIGVVVDNNIHADESTSSIKCSIGFHWVKVICLPNHASKCKVDCYRTDSKMKSCVDITSVTLICYWTEDEHCIKIRHFFLQNPSK